MHLQLNMKKILILGALPKEKKRERLYNAVINVCKNFTDKISSPIDTARFKGNDKERYKRAFKKVKQADLIIGEQSKPSTRQGMEIREAAILNKSLIVIAKTGSKVSGLVKGCPILKKIIYYDNIKDLKLKLLNYFK